MSELRGDVNFRLGSWGAQPEDHPDIPRILVNASSLLTVDDWRELTRRWADHAIVEIEVGHPEMAGEYARGAARFALEYQKKGGKPWD